jgi:hypothetical protein
MTLSQQHNPSQQIKATQTLSVNIDGCINLDTNSDNIIKFANFDHNNSALINEKFILNIGGRTIPCSSLILIMNESKQVSISKISMNGRDFIDFNEMSQALVRVVSPRTTKEVSDLKADSLESFERLKLGDIIQNTIKKISSEKNINFNKAKKLVDDVETKLSVSLRILCDNKDALLKFNELANLLKSNKKATKLATLALILNKNGLNNKDKELFEPINQVINKLLETFDGRSLNTTMRGVRPSEHQQIKDLALVLSFLNR